MTSIKKVVLIPEDKYRRVLSQHKETTVDNTDKNTVKIEETPQIFDDDEESRHSEPSGNSHTTSHAHSENDATRKSKWLLGIPSTFNRNVQALLEHLRDHKDIISWNDRGEIVYKGQVITGSNLSDLLRDSQKEYKYLDPYGDREFYRAWAEVNIPEGLLGNEKRKAEVRWYKRNPDNEYLPPPPGIPQRTVPKRKMSAPSGIAKRSIPKKKWLRI